MGAADSGSITVLHVDDDTDFAELTGVYLQRITPRFDVAIANSASEARRILAEDDVDCVVSDFDMPGTDGIEFLREVREFDRSLPFVLFTGKGSEEVASEAISSGVTDYLQKEGGTEQYAVLANRIENLVSKHRAEQLVDRAFRAMDSSREGIALLDEDGEFIYVNEAYTDIVGYSQTELLGSFWELVYPDEQVTRIHEQILASVPSEGRWTGDTVYQHKDGSRIVVNHALAYSEEGTMICLIRERGIDDEDAVRQERERFDLFIDSVEEYAIFMLDPDGYIVSWNSGAERLTGYARDDILGEHVSTLYPDDDREAGVPSTLLLRALEEGQIEQQGTHVRRDGTRFSVDASLTALYDDEDRHRGFGNVIQTVDGEP